MNKPVNCRCGGEPVVEKHQLYEEQIEDMFIVRCAKCDIQTSPEYKKEKVIETWNKAMGERTAKVSNQIFNNSNPYTVGAWIGICECGELVSYSSKYCHMCGAKLDWSE